MIQILIKRVVRQIVELGHADLPQAGAGSQMDRGDVERLFQLLALESAFGERFERNGLGFTNAYITVGPRASVILSGKQPIVMSFSEKTVRATSTTTTNKRPAKRIQVDLQPDEVELLLEDDTDDDLAAVDVESWRPAARRMQTPALQNVPDDVLLGDIHEQCYGELVAIRDRHAMDEDVDPEAAFPSDILQEIAATMPSNEAGFLAIEGMTKDLWYWFTEARALRIVDRYRHILDQLRHDAQPFS